MLLAQFTSKDNSEVYLKGTSRGNLSFYTSKQQTANETLTKHPGIPPSFVSMDGTFFLAIVQDTCKSLCHDVFSGIFVTVLFVVYSLYFLVCSPFVRNKLNKKGIRTPEICMAALL